MFGLSRNALFAIGGVLLAGVLYLGFSGSDDAADKAGDATAEKGKKSGKKKSGKKRKAVATSALGVGKICVKLDCSPEQLASFKALVKEHRTQTSANRRALREANALIAAEFSEASLNEAALDEAFESIEDQRVAVDEDARSVLAALHGQLSPEQRETLAKLVALHGPSALLSRPADGGGQRRATPGRGAGKKGKGKKGRRQGGRKRKKGKHDVLPAGEPSRAVPRASDAALEARRAAAASNMVDPIKPTRTPVAPVDDQPAPADPAGTDGA